MWGGRGQPIRGPQHFILLSQCLYRGGRFGWCACRTHKSGGARIRQAKHPEGIDRAAKKELLRSHYRQRYAALVELGRLFCPWDEGEARVTSPPVRQPARCCPRKRHVWGDEGKAVGCVPPTALLFEGVFLTSIKDADCDVVAEAPLALSRLGQSEGWFLQQASSAGNGQRSNRQHLFRRRIFQSGARHHSAILSARAKCRLHAHAIRLWTESP